MSLDNAKLMNDTTVSPNILYLSAYVRNTGKVSLNITTAYIDGTKVDLTTPVILSEGVVKEVRIDQGSGPGDYPWATGHTYTVKLICKDNTQLSFSIKG